jgi:hypothetical protein
MEKETGPWESRTNSPRTTADADATGLREIILDQCAPEMAPPKLFAVVIAHSASSQRCHQPQKAQASHSNSYLLPCYDPNSLRTTWTDPYPSGRSPLPPPKPIAQTQSAKFRSRGRATKPRFPAWRSLLHHSSDAKWSIAHLHKSVPSKIKIRNEYEPRILLEKLCISSHDDTCAAVRATANRTALAQQLLEPNKSHESL